MEDQGKLSMGIFLLKFNSNHFVQGPVKQYVRLKTDGPEEKPQSK